MGLNELLVLQQLCGLPADVWRVRVPGGWGSHVMEKLSCQLHCLPLCARGGLLVILLHDAGTHSLLLSICYPTTFPLPHLALPSQTPTPHPHSHPAPHTQAANQPSASPAPVVPLLGWFMAPPSNPGLELIPEDAPDQDSLWVVYRWERLRPLSAYMMSGPPKGTSLLPWNRCVGC